MLSHHQEAPEPAKLVVVVFFSTFLTRKLLSPPADRRENTSDPRHGRQDAGFREGFRVPRRGVPRTAQGLPVPRRLRSLRQHRSHHGVPGETPGWLEAAASGGGGGASTKSERVAGAERWTSHLTALSKGFHAEAGRADRVPSRRGPTTEL